MNKQKDEVLEREGGREGGEGGRRGKREDSDKINIFTTAMILLLVVSAPPTVDNPLYCLRR